MNNRAKHKYALYLVAIVLVVFEIIPTCSFAEYRHHDENRYFTSKFNKLSEMVDSIGTKNATLVVDSHILIDKNFRFALIFIYDIFCRIAVVFLPYPTNKGVGYGNESYSVSAELESS